MDWTTNKHKRNKRKTVDLTDKTRQKKKELLFKKKKLVIVSVGI